MHVLQIMKSLLWGAVILVTLIVALFTATVLLANALQSGSMPPPFAVFLVVSFLILLLFYSGSRRAPLGQRTALIEIAGGVFVLAFLAWALFNPIDPNGCGDVLCRWFRGLPTYSFEAFLVAFVLPIGAAAIRDGYRRYVTHKP